MGSIHSSWPPRRPMRRSVAGHFIVACRLCAVEEPLARRPPNLPRGHSPPPRVAEPPPPHSPPVDTAPAPDIFEPMLPCCNGQGLPLWVRATMEDPAEGGKQVGALPGPYRRRNPAGTPPSLARSYGRRSSCRWSACRAATISLGGLMAWVRTGHSDVGWAHDGFRLIISYGTMTHDPATTPTCKPFRRLLHTHQ
uniref:Uncharacterized protein n=1 Tax=Leersia perrieri TaxID=77586 RepID=A0A0D9XBT2_9ORYZ